MPKHFSVRTYGAVDFRIKATSMREAKAKLHRMFDKENVVDPLTNRIITDRVTCLGYAILLPEDTREITHDCSDVPR